MGRPRTVSDTEILSAARAVFLESGPGASTQVIADRIGLSQAGLFKRFGTKQDLMVAALLPTMPPFISEISSGPNLEQPLHPQLHLIARDFAIFFRRMVPCLMVLKSSGIDLEAVLKAFEEPPPLMTRRLLTSYFNRAQAGGIAQISDPAAVASLFLGAFHLHSFMSHITEDVMSDEALFAFSDAVVDMLWLGIAPKEAS